MADIAASVLSRLKNKAAERSTQRPMISIQC